MRFLACLLFLGFAHPATAAECPWDEVESVQAKMTKVYVNGTEYKVRGADARTAFEETLGACEEPEAAEEFKRWRANRRMTNTYTALVLAGPTGLLAIFSAINAGARKKAMVSYLE